MWFTSKKKLEEEERRRKEAEAQIAALAKTVEEIKKKEEERVQKEEAEKAEKERIERLAKEEEERKNAAKNLATKRGEPYISIKEIDVDDEAITQGAFEMDWNDLFIQKLRKHGYNADTEEAMVELWFYDVCRHILLSTFEQEEANIGITTKVKDLGDGKREYS